MDVHAAGSGEFPLLDSHAGFVPLSHSEMTAPGAIVPWCPSPVALVEDLVGLLKLVRSSPDSPGSRLQCGLAVCRHCFVTATSISINYAT